MMTFSSAMSQAHRDGKMTAHETNQLMTASSLDFGALISALISLAAYFPPLAPFVSTIKLWGPMIQWFADLIRGATPSPLPIPSPTPVPNGGGEQPPIPVIR